MRSMEKSSHKFIARCPCLNPDNFQEIGMAGVCSICVIEELAVCTLSPPIVSHIEPLTQPQRQQEVRMTKLPKSKKQEQLM